METIGARARFQYGDWVRPYIVSQLTGAYQSVPTFLDRQHQITTRRTRRPTWRGCGPSRVVLDQETDRVRHDAGP